MLGVVSLSIVMLDMVVGEEEIPDYTPDKFGVLSCNVIFFVVLFIFAVFET